MPEFARTIAGILKPKELMPHLRATESRILKIRGNGISLNDLDSIFRRHTDISCDSVGEVRC